jgi:tetratricopeptide (TPR) repeat protein
VLEGSVRSAGDRLRITAQLINAGDGYHIWSETYDRKLDDVFSVQDEISRAILTALKTHLLGDAGGTATPADALEVPGAGAPATADPVQAGSITAYQQLLMGRERMVQRTKGDLKAASRHFQEALRLAPDYAAAHAEYARATLLLEDSNSTYGDLSKEEVDATAWPHIERAIELNKNLPEAYAVKGLYQVNRGKPEDAITSFAKAIELNPNYAEAYMWRSMAWGALGSRRQELADLEKAHKLDPISAVVSFNLTNKIANSGRMEEAIKIARQTLEYNPNTLLAALSLASLQTKQGDYAASVKTLIAADDRTDDPRVNKALSEAFLVLGLEDAAARYIPFEQGHVISWVKGDLEGAWALAEIQADRQPTEGWPLMYMAYYLSELGHTDEARATAEKAYALLKDKPGEPFAICNPLLAAGFGNPSHPSVQEIGSTCHRMIEEFAGSRTKNSGILEAMAALDLVTEKDVRTIVSGFEKAYSHGARSWFLNHVKLPDYVANDPGFKAFMTKLNGELALQRTQIRPLLETILASAAAT